MVHLPASRRTVALRGLALALGLAACGDEDETVFTCGDTPCPSPDGKPQDAGASLPCEVEFLSPLASDAGTLELAAADDGDARACGESFSTSVLIASSASRVNLFVNENPLGARPVRGGQIRFEAELGNRGRTSNTLRAEATMPDGRRCSAALGTRLFVDCPGPSCSVDAPRANRDGALNQDDDADPSVGGLQTTVTVATELENIGQDVHLTIDDRLDAVPATQVLASDGAGLASFAGITLEQGDRSVRAECVDPGGRRTRSPRVEWRVDTASCSLRITQVAGGSNPITPADDVDANQANGLDVLVRGTIEGEGCESVQIGACAADLPAIGLSGLMGSDGGFIVPIKLPGAAGRVELCARVKDSAGNVSAPDERVEVDVRLESPALVILSPAAGARYNRSGGSGAFTDLELDSQATCELDVVVACRDLGVLVELLVDGEVQAGTACVEQAGAAAPFSGLATFAGVSLPSRDDGQTTTLSARQSLPGLPAGVSSGVTVQADCNPPSCSFQSPDPEDPVLGAALDDPGAAGFQTDFIVVSDAESAGSNVRLAIDGNLDSSRNAAALSSAEGSTATFAAVPLSESLHEVQATCSDPAGNLLSTALVSWTVDVTPAPSIGAPACGGELALLEDDVSPGVAGLQVDVSVLNDGAPDVTLTVEAGAQSAELTQTGDATSTEFDAVSLGGEGSVTLSACATDAQGNTGCGEPCELTIVAEPTLTITSPRPPAVLTIEDDCDEDEPGLQVQVRGTSDAQDGEQVVVTLGASPPSSVTLSNGRYVACVAAADGDDQLLTAGITDGATGLSRTTSVRVSINTSPPPAIAAPTFEVTGRREGTVALGWTSVLDSSGDPLIAYHLRCAAEDITSEPEWASAQEFPLTRTPAGDAGEEETDEISEFRTGMSRFCMLRGEDAYGMLGELGGTTLISNPFLELEYTGMPNNVGTRLSVTALGDVNGDGFDDFGYGTQHLGAVIYFGGPDLDTSPDIVITIDSAAISGQTTHDLGANVVGLGDVNGDGRPDFAVTARALNQPGATAGGAVFIFFGRAASAPWGAPATIQVAPSPGCGADLCLHSTEQNATLGSSITSTDFDGDGEADLVIGAQTRTHDDATTLVGRVYVVLGGSRLAAGGVRPMPSGTIDGFVIDPNPATTRNFGINVAAVGLSAGRGDLVITARGSGQVRGEAFSVPGQEYTLSSGLQTVTLPSAFAAGTPGAAFGTPMRAVGDMNGDDAGDVWVTTNLDLGGVLPVYLGRAAGFSSLSLLSFTNDVNDNEWGSYVATGFSTELGPLGDLDDNGYDDLLVGSIFAQNNPGSIELFYSDATSGNRRRSSADATYVSSANGYMTPGFVGDIDADGFRDVAIVESRRAATLPATPGTILKLLH